MMQQKRTFGCFASHHCRTMQVRSPPCIRYEKKENFGPAHRARIARILEVCQNSAMMHCIGVCNAYETRSPTNCRHCPFMRDVGDGLAFFTALSGFGRTSPLSRKFKPKIPRIPISLFPFFSISASLCILGSFWGDLGKWEHLSFLTGRLEVGRCLQTPPVRRFGE
jgi:hypothetical protein